jgi:hypothetical protein
LILKLPTSGFQNPILKYAVTRTNNGATQQAVYYRTSDGGSWIFINDIEVSEVWQPVVIDFSEIPQSNNNPHFEVRILFTDENAAGASGNNRFDNLQLEGFSTSVRISNPEDASVSLFPNPAGKTVHLTSDFAIESITVIDINGRIVIKKHPAFNALEINTSSLSAGVYLVKINTGSSILTRKLIIR